MSQSNPTIHERLAVLEERSKADRLKLNEINKKLDEILELKAKGMGAFWLASAFIGIIFAALGSGIVSWIRG